MDSSSRNSKPHVVCIAFPAQGHVTPIFQLAQVLHLRNFHVTFVNSEYNHRRLLKARGPNALDGIPGFQFKTFSDGLPLTDGNGTQDIPTLVHSMDTNSFHSVLALFRELNSSDDSPPLTCAIIDAPLGFAFDAAEKLGIPKILYWTPSAAGVLAYSHFGDLVEKGITPLKDSSYLTNGYLETVIDWIPAMKNIPLKNLPSFIRTTDKDDIMFDHHCGGIRNTYRSSAVIMNTFDAMEKNVLEALSLKFPPIYTIGPLTLLLDQIPKTNLDVSLWKEEPTCLEWLDSREPKSVIYVNFGSIAVISEEHMLEFAWGLANSKKPFLWIVRPDLVVGEKAILPPEFVEETKDRGMLASWCNQAKVLKHKAIGGFLSHMGWNSVLENISGGGVPMICWSFFAEQQTNCWFASGEWGIGMEINSDVKRDEVEMLVRELFDGEKGKKLRNKAIDLNTKANEALKPGGSSHVHLDELVSFIRAI